MTFPTTGPAPAAGDGRRGGRRNWALAAGALAALISSFLGYYTIEFTDRIATDLCRRTDLPTSVRTVCRGDPISAWHAFFGGFGVVLLVVAGLTGVLTSIGPGVAVRVRAQAIGVVTAGGGLVCTVAAAALTPGGDVADLLPRSGLSEGDVYDVGPGPAYWAVLVIAVAMTALAAAPTFRARAVALRVRRADAGQRAAVRRSPEAAAGPSVGVAPPHPLPLAPIETIQPSASSPEEYYGPPPTVAPPWPGMPQQ